MIGWGEKSSGTIQVGGASLEYAHFGNAEKDRPVIVLLHEGLGCVALWRSFPQALARATGCAVFAYSRLGYGQSDPVSLPRPLDYMTREAEEVLPQVLNAIGASSVILMGHSDGATIAAIYAGSVVDHRVRGLILMAPHFFCEKIGLDAIRAAGADYETGELRDRLAKYHADVDGAFQGWNDAWLDPGFADWNVTETIDYWRVPVLAIQGLQDQYGTNAQISEIVERAYCPVDSLMLDNCRHAPHQDQPEAVLQAVGEFTDRLQRIEAATVEMA